MLPGYKYNYKNFPLANYLHNNFVDHGTQNKANITKIPSPPRQMKDASESNPAKIEMLHRDQKTSIHNHDTNSANRTANTHRVLQGVAQRGVQFYLILRFSGPFFYAAK